MVEDESMKDSLLNDAICCLVRLVNVEGACHSKPLLLPRCYWPSMAAASHDQDFYGNLQSGCLLHLVHPPVENQIKVRGERIARRRPVLILSKWPKTPTHGKSENQNIWNFPQKYCPVLFFPVKTESHCLDIPGWPLWHFIYLQNCMIFKNVTDCCLIYHFKLLTMPKIF